MYYGGRLQLSDSYKPVQSFPFAILHVTHQTKVKTLS